jgi:hypothetical protein
VLQSKFSTGVTFCELLSIADVLARCANTSPPPREARRTFSALLWWFRVNWALVAPWLPLVELRDKENLRIDGRREVLEKSVRTIW